jgi:hypothetical protein
LSFLLSVAAAVVARLQLAIMLVAVAVVVAV